MHVVVPARFSGPVGTGNGGIVSALVAAPLEAPAEATLRRPVPLDRVLDRRLVAPDRVELHLGDAPDSAGVLAEAVPLTRDLHPPAPVGVDLAREATTRFPWRHEHSFATCFTCGIDRTEGDGLRIHCGPVGDGRFAAPWVPNPSLVAAPHSPPVDPAPAPPGAPVDPAPAPPGAPVDPAFVWAALDCPTAIPVLTALGSGPALLGRLAVRIEALPRVGQTVVVVSEGRGHEGRKRYGAAALYTVEGELLATSEATWVELRDPVAGPAGGQPAD